MRIALVGVTLSLALAGCGSGSTGTTTSTDGRMTLTDSQLNAKQVMAKKFPALSDDEQTYLGILGTDRDRKYLGQYPAEDLVNVGHATCDALDDGWTLGEVGQLSGAVGVDDRGMALIVVTAVNVFCPENQNVFN